MADNAVKRKFVIQDANNFFCMGYIYISVQGGVCPEDNTWLPAEVSRVCQEPRSYKVTTPNGSVLIEE